MTRLPNPKSFDDGITTVSATSSRSGFSRASHKLRKKLNKHRANSFDDGNTTVSVTSHKSDFSRASNKLRRKLSIPNESLFDDGISAVSATSQKSALTRASHKLTKKFDILIKKKTKGEKMIVTPDKELEKDKLNLRQESTKATVSDRNQGQKIAPVTGVELALCDNACHSTIQDEDSDWLDSTYQYISTIYSYTPCTDNNSLVSSVSNSSLEAESHCREEDAVELDAEGRAFGFTENGVKVVYPPQQRSRMLRRVFSNLSVVSAATIFSKKSTKSKAKIEDDGISVLSSMASACTGVKRRNAAPNVVKLQKTSLEEKNNHSTTYNSECEASFLSSLTNRSKSSRKSKKKKNSKTETKNQKQKVEQPLHAGKKDAKEPSRRVNSEAESPHFFVECVSLPKERSSRKSGKKTRKLKLDKPESLDRAAAVSHDSDKEDSKYKTSLERRKGKIVHQRLKARHAAKANIFNKSHDNGLPNVKNGNGARLKLNKSCDETLLDLD